MTLTLKSHVCGTFVAGRGKPALLVDPSTEEVLAEASSEGVDFGAAVDFARRTGGAALRAMSFAARGEMLAGMARALHAKRDELLDLGMRNGGNTRSDAKFDVDGAIGTLQAYAELGRSLGDAGFFVDGESIAAGRSSRLVGQHVLVPRRGVAVHINAYNFPAWGLAEKAAVALLAGVPVITKPATSTALLSFRVMELLVESGVLPDGALQFIAGSTGDLVSHLGAQDVLAFTGSGTVGTLLRGTDTVVARAVRVNVEADSLNTAILGPDVERGSDDYLAFLADVARDITQKSGQKCTAIRRVLVPRAMLDDVCEDLADRLSTVKTGNPFAEGVTMGPVSTASQRADVQRGLGDFLRAGARAVVGGADPVAGIGAPEGRGFFVAPTLLRLDDARAVPAVHAHEVFGPSATVMPYDTVDDALDLLALGGGCLVSSAYTSDRSTAAAFALGAAAWTGRFALVNARMAGAWLGPGTVLPQLVHGGPGRAGGGEELGGVRGMSLYLQRTALQGYGPLVEQIVSAGKRL